MTYDLVIKNGMVIDGTGFARYRADLGIKDGTIATIGQLRGAAATTTIDADGLFVTPGIIDLHTHYDAQPFWDKLCTPSIWHGVTTVLAGNCGLTLAPLRPEHRAAGAPAGGARITSNFPGAAFVLRQVAYHQSYEP